MAGEKIMPMTPAGMVSVEYTVPKNATVAKGDLIQLGGCMAFALADGAAGETISLCIRCNLVDFPGFNEALKAGDRIEFNTEGDGSQNPSIRTPSWGNNPGKQYAPNEYIGIAHRNHADTDTRIEVCFVHD